MRETKKIPKKKYFFSSLTNSQISDEDYAHSKNVFSAFSCKDMIDYTELYCLLDVGILAEVIIQFRNLAMEKFQLDCAHYISLPQLSFDAMLKISRVEIELLTDIDQILFIGKKI